MAGKTVSITLPPEAAAKLANAYRIAAETSRQQFPADDSRYNYYIEQARKYEFQATPVEHGDCPRAQHDGIRIQLPTGDKTP